MFTKLFVMVLGLWACLGLPAGPARGDDGQSSPDAVGQVPLVTAGSALDHPGPVSEQDLMAGRVAPPVQEPREDPAVMALTAKFLGHLGQILAQIRQTPDPQKAEELQKQCEQTKADEQKARLELLATQAEEKGDGARATELRSALRDLQKPQPVSPASPSARPVPAPNSKPTAPRTKTPDDR